MPKNLTTDCSRFDASLSAAREGSRDALTILFGECRLYLMLVANQGLDPQLRAKVGASDLVQESLMQAQANISNFRGETRDEFVAWLRQILIDHLRQTRRSYRDTAKRSLEREASLHSRRGNFSAAADLLDPRITPRTQAVAAEESALLHRAMNRLAERHRLVIRYRNWQELSFSEIGEKMGLTPDAARKLWSRAIVRLKQVLRQ